MEAILSVFHDKGFAFVDMRGNVMVKKTEQEGRKVTLIEGRKVTLIVIIKNGTPSSTSDKEDTSTHDLRGAPKNFRPVLAGP